MKLWIFPALIMAQALIYEVVALNRDDMWEWSELLWRLSEHKLMLVWLTLTLGLILGHALAPHVSRFP